MVSPSGNINNLFFNGVYKDVWKKINAPGLTEAEVDFIQQVAALQSEDRVLDLMCGYGRHTLALAKNGIHITAIDNQEAYISEIQAESASSSLPVRTVLSDVLEFVPVEKFDAAICMGNSFAFFNKEDSVQLLRIVENSLKQKGIFILNTWMIAEIAIRHFREKDWFYAGEYKYLLDYSFCFHPTRIESEQIIIAPDGIIETNRGIDYIFSLDELNEMCRSAGLQILDLFATPRKKKFKLGDGQVYIVIGKINP